MGQDNRDRAVLDAIDRLADDPRPAGRFPGRPAWRAGELNFGSRGVPVTGAALSPGGRMLALSLVHGFPAGPLYGSLEVINLTSGATRTWTGRSTPGYWPGIPSWANGGTVVVPWWHSAYQGMIPAGLTGIRQLDAVAPGGGTARCLPCPRAGPAVRDDRTQRR